VSKGNHKNKYFFLFQNLAKGFLWLGLLIIAFMFFKKNVSVDYLDWLSPVYERPLLVYLIYAGSEILFGIIPPEIFMIWALQQGKLLTYVQIIMLLAVLSYLAGILGFLAGRYFHNTQFFKLLKDKIFGKYDVYLYRFGAFIIIVAALTPLPFSGVSMLIGSVDFPFKKYLIFAMARFIRFLAYSIVIWQANTL